MARHRNHNLLLTLEQYEWVAKTIARKAEIAQKIEKDKSLKAMVTRFAEKFTTLPEPSTNGEYILQTNRLEIRFLYEVVRNAHAVHAATVIPGYEEKSKKDAYFKPRYEMAIKVTAMLANLNNKIAVVLG